MMRNLSNLCFGLALGSSLLMKLFTIQNELIWLAVCSVAVTAILTNLMRVRFIGVAGVGGLSILFSKLIGISIIGTILTVLTAAFLVVAVLMAICADISIPSKVEEGNKNQHETQD
jgi:uncharacterized membrane protein